MIRKIQSIHLYLYHACLNKLTCCLVQNVIKHYLRSYMSLEFESLVQNGSNSPGHSCISPIHSFCHVSCMHHIVASRLVMFVYRCSLRQVLPPRSITNTLTKNNKSPWTRKASNQPFDHIDTNPCSRSCSLLLHLRQHV